MDIRDEVAAWRAEARQSIPVLFVFSELLRRDHPFPAGELKDIAERLTALLDKAPKEPRAFSSSYSVQESNPPTFPRVIRNG